MHTSERIAAAELYIYTLCAEEGRKEKRREAASSHRSQKFTPRAHFQERSAAIVASSESSPGNIIRNCRLAPAQLFTFNCELMALLQLGDLFFVRVRDMQVTSFR